MNSKIERAFVWGQCGTNTNGGGEGANFVWGMQSWGNIKRG